MIFRALCRMQGRRPPRTGEQAGWMVYDPSVTTPFHKMHGAGNDFLVLDARAESLPLSADRIRALGDRRTGIGWDQLIVLEPPEDRAADGFMRIFNPDGSAAGACGNATRCVAAFLGAQTGGAAFTVQTVAGLLPAQRLGGGKVCVDMGAPRLDWRDIPLAHACDTLHLDLPGDPAAASMGNPHATFFVPDLDAIDPAALGPELEHNALFPDRANIGFAQILSPERLLLRVWERGAGLTLACGSGACAALVNAVRRGLAGRSAALVLDGGTLEIEWRAQDSHVLMTGPTALAFQGAVDLSTYPP
jgi:diaminopimelate epimerase